MVKVATGLDLPIKILWPKSLIFSDARGFTMLGLGDIVVPGLFISLALRFDLSRSGHRDASQAFEKPYFRSAILAYILGLLTTMGVMHSFGAAQPALLYLRYVGDFEEKRPLMTVGTIALRVYCLSFSRQQFEGS